MTSVKLKLNKDRILLNGTYPLVFQVIHRRRKKLIYSRFKVAEPDYDAGQEKVVYRKDVIVRFALSTVGSQRNGKS